MKVKGGKRENAVKFGVLVQIVNWAKSSIYREVLQSSEAKRDPD